MEIELSPVVTGLNTGDMIYLIKYTDIIDSNDFPTYMASRRYNLYNYTFSHDEKNYYFIIRHPSLETEKTYPGIRIESDKII